MYTCYANVGFMKKDLYNHIDRNRHPKTKDGDAMIAFGYLDPLFFSRNTLTNDMGLKICFGKMGAA